MIYNVRNYARDPKTGNIEEKKIYMQLDSMCDTYKNIKLFKTVLTIYIKIKILNNNHNNNLQNLDTGTTIFHRTGDAC